MTLRIPMFLAALILSGCDVAKAADAVARLDAELTPLGAVRAGNADGSIPAWDGGLTPDRAAALSSDARYVDPYPDEMPLFSITRANVETYAARLTPGQIALIAALPDDFSLPVYPSHRSGAAPAAFYEATQRNAVAGGMPKDDGSFAEAGAGLPFPILAKPEDGLRLFWNQRLRWRGQARERTLNAASISASGDMTVVRLQERDKFVDHDTSATSGPLHGVLAASLLVGLEPQQMLGVAKLIYDMRSPPGRAWQRSPGPAEPLLSRTGYFGNDTSFPGANGLLDEDQREGYDGTPERYDWLYKGEREIYVPYNAYRLHAPAANLADVMGPRHPETNRLRYELHRVRVLDARLKRTLSATWPHRIFYIDEDSSQILLVDLYDHDDHLRSVQEVHSLMAYDRALLLPFVDLVYDLTGRRYLATGLSSGEPEIKLDDLGAALFTPESAQRWAKKLGSGVPKAGNR